MRTSRTKEEGGNQKWDKLSSFASEAATRNNSPNSQRKPEDKIDEDILKRRKEKVVRPGYLGACI